MPSNTAGWTVSRRRVSIAKRALTLPADQYAYPHPANTALTQQNANDIFAAPSPYSYFHNMSVPSPLSHNHTGPAGFSPVQRTASPLGGIGVNAAGHGLMPSYGSGHCLSKSLPV